VIKSIDRLGRNYDMIIEEWSYITKKIKADIVVLDMNILDTRYYNDKLIMRFVSDIVLQILCFVAENERDYIKERQREGIKIAKEKGVIFGRPKIQLPNNIDNVFSLYLNKQIKIKEALKITKLSCGSFYKYYNIYKNNLYYK